MTRTLALAIAVGVLTLSVAAVRHDDDTDPALYSVVARHLAEDGAWFDLRYTENVHPKFREHLPFGFWPGAVLVRTGAEAALPWLGVLFSALTIGLVAWLGRKLGGERLGALATIVLATTEQFVTHGASFRLDPPLLFFGTLAALPVLVLDAPDRRGWALTAVATALAVLIKGPFGAVAPVAAALARTLVDRRGTWLIWAGSAIAVGSVPFAVFLWRAWATQSDWWSGYVEAQLLASATGARTDGETGAWVPWMSVVTRFWPWLPAAGLGLFALDVRNSPRPTRLFTAWAGVTLLVLMLPSRKLWHHVLVVFPALALLAAGALRPWFERRGTYFTPALVIAGVLGALVTGTVARPRAVSCSEFASALQLPAGTPVVVGTSDVSSHWKEVAVLAKELHLRPWLVGAPEQFPTEARTAVVPSTWTPPEGWHVTQSARDWSLWAR